MFQSFSLCSLRFVSPVGQRSGRSFGSGWLGRFALAAGVALAVVAVLGSQPREAARSGAGDEVAPLILRADTPAALRDQAEAVRAGLLATPGVGAVTLEGLHQQRLAVEYVPARLAALGITPADLARGLPVDAARSRAGHLALRADAGLDSPQDVVNLPVRAGRRVFRLGDVAFVSRAPLEPPVSVLRVDGKAAVRVLVVPTK